MMSKCCPTHHPHNVASGKCCGCRKPVINLGNHILSNMIPTELIFTLPSFPLFHRCCRLLIIHLKNLKRAYSSKTGWLLLLQNSPQFPSLPKGFIFMPHAHERMCFSVRKTSLIRCHVVLEAVTCQGSSHHLSITTGLFSVCAWLGSVHPNTHICCSSMGWTTQRSAIKMTLIVKHNWIQRRFRCFLTLGPGDQTSWQLWCSKEER